MKGLHGCIENCIGNNFSGWISQPEQLVDKAKHIEIYIAGEFFDKVDLFEALTSRVDIREMPGCRAIDFSFDETLFFSEISESNITFRIRSGVYLGSLKVVPQLLIRSVSSLLTKTGIAAGRISSDETAIVGSGGVLYLKTGTNDLQHLYKDEAAVDTEAWLRILRARATLLSTLGIKYVQMITPEKTSVMYWAAPYHATKESPGLTSLIEGIIKDEVLKNSFLNPRKFIPDEIHVSGFFRTFDTHMSTVGAKTVVEALIDFVLPSYLNCYSPKNICFGTSDGDLGGRFQEDGVVIETIPLYCNLTNLSGSYLEPSLISAYDPVGGNQDTRRTWRCGDAPIQLTVLCFGGSTFERGEVSTTLSWWLSRIFKEFHFVWSPRMDIDLIREIKPDLVICQTVERFLTITPSM